MLFEKHRYIRDKSWIKDYKFLATPLPQKDELLSSWLTRSAFAHGMTLNNFFSHFIRHDGTALTRTDMDFQLKPKLIENIAKSSNIAIETIQQMSLRSEEGYLYTSDGLCPPKAIRKLIDKRTHFGLMYCPLCLAEDKHSYYRKQWRYLFYNACPKHGIYLKDRCGICFESIKLKNMHIKSQIVFCHNCGRDLRLTRPVKVQNKHQYGLEAIRWFDQGLKKGYFVINNYKVHSLFVFQAFTNLRYLINRQNHLILNDFLMFDDYKKLCKKLKHYSSKKCGPIYKDFFMTAIIYYLFQNYPHNLQNVALENNLTHRDFTHGFKNIPFWYKEMIDEVIPIQNKVGREISESEVVGAINYLKKLRKNVTQESVAEVVGCHSTVHKGFVKTYKKVTK
jgi:hypothetical protein